MTVTRESEALERLHQMEERYTEARADGSGRRCAGQY